FLDRQTGLPSPVGRRRGVIADTVERPRRNCKSPRRFAVEASTRLHSGGRRFFVSALILLLTGRAARLLYELAHLKRTAMRITNEAKLATRRRILDAARELFARDGFDAAATRDLAREAGIAAGTLFNYFPTKEALALCLAAEALAEARDSYQHKRRGD